jgi:hypothetical protein
VFNVPVVLTTVETKGFSDYLWFPILRPGRGVAIDVRASDKQQDQLTKGNNP